MVANIVSTFAPKLMFSKVAEPSALSRDPKVPAAYIADPLVSTTVSARWFTSVLAAHADTHARASTLSLPALIMQSGDDRVADPAATRSWVAAAPSDLIDYVEWEGLYHEMFNEPEKEMVFARVEAWLDERLSRASHPPNRSSSSIRSRIDRRRSGCDSGANSKNTPCSQNSSCVAHVEFLRVGGRGEGAGYLPRVSCPSLATTRRRAAGVRGD